METSHSWAAFATRCNSETYRGELQGRVRQIRSSPSHHQHVDEQRAVAGPDRRARRCH